MACISDVSERLLKSHIAGLALFFYLLQSILGTVFEPLFVPIEHLDIPLQAAIDLSFDQDVPRLEKLTG